MNATRETVCDDAPALPGSSAPHPAHDGRVCDLCGGQAFTLLHGWAAGDRWNPVDIPIAIWRCRCGLAFLHPVPSPDQLPARGEWWSQQRRQFRRRGAFKEWWRVVRHTLVGTGKERLLRQTRKAVPRGRFLDVGCGGGRMLGVASRFYEVTGLEPSAVGAARAREKGFHVIEETLEGTTVPPGSFDVVMLDSVIEHVLSPRAALLKVNELLMAGGVVVLLTPKFGGPAYRRHGADWNGFRHGYHTHLFNGETLGRYLRETGFDVLVNPRRDRMLDDILVLWGRKPAAG